MIVYFILFFFLLILAYFIRYGKSKATSGAAFLLAGIALTMVAGFRYNVGTDYTSYVSNYYRYISNALTLFSQPASSFVARLSSLIYDDYATWFLLMSLVTIVPIMIVIKKYSRNPGYAIIFYVLLGCWHISFNLVKQSAAAAILFLGYGAVLDRNFKKWVVYCCIAALFHVTAILMIPIFWLAQPKITFKNTIAIVAIGIATLFLYDYLFNFVTILKQGEGLVNMNSATATESVNILRILVNCAPILLFAIIGGKNTIKTQLESNDISWSQYNELSLLFNLSLVNAMLNIGSMNSIYLNRFCCYTNMFNILFVPTLLKRTNKKFVQYRFVNSCIFALYFVFWTYDLSKGSTTANYNWIFNR